MIGGKVSKISLKRNKELGRMQSPAEGSRSSPQLEESTRVLCPTPGVFHRLDYSPWGPDLDVTEGLKQLSTLKHAQIVVGLETAESSEITFISLWREKLVQTCVMLTAVHVFPGGSRLPHRQDDHQADHIYWRGRQQRPQSRRQLESSLPGELSSDSGWEGWDAVNSWSYSSLFFLLSCLMRSCILMLEKAAVISAVISF